MILRAETEWIEIVEVGAAKLTDADPKVILDSFHHYLQSPPTYFPPLFGDGEAAKEILNALLEKRSNYNLFTIKYLLNLRLLNLL